MTKQTKNRLKAKLREAEQEVSRANFLCCFYQCLVGLVVSDLHEQLWESPCLAFCFLSSGLQDKREDTHVLAGN